MANWIVDSLAQGTDGPTVFTDVTGRTSSTISFEIRVDDVSPFNSAGGRFAVFGNGGGDPTILIAGPPSNTSIAVDVGVGSPTYTVDGVTPDRRRGALFNAIVTGGFVTVEIVNVDLTGFTNGLTLSGSTSDFRWNGEVRNLIIDGESIDPPGSGNESTYPITLSNSVVSGQLGNSPDDLIAGARAPGRGEYHSSALVFTLGQEAFDNPISSATLKLRIRTPGSINTAAGHPPHARGWSTTLGLLESNTLNGFVPTGLPPQDWHRYDSNYFYGQAPITQFEFRESTAIRIALDSVGNSGPFPADLHIDRDADFSDVEINLLPLIEDAIDTGAVTPQDPELILVWQFERWEHFFYYQEYFFAAEGPQSDGAPVLEITAEGLGLPSLELELLGPADPIELGESVQIIVRRTGGDQTQPLVVSLDIASSTVSGPSEVTIPANSTDYPFDVIAQSAGSTDINVNANDASAAYAITVVDSSAPTPSPSGFPVEADVREGVVFGSSDEFVGTLVVSPPPDPITIPLPADVRTGVVFGTNDELTGTLEVSATGGVSLTGQQAEALNRLFNMTELDGSGPRFTVAALPQAPTPTVSGTDRTDEILAAIDTRAQPSDVSPAINFAPTIQPTTLDAAERGEIASLILANPANPIVTDDSGHVTSTNDGGGVGGDSASAIYDFFTEGTRAEAFKATGFATPGDVQTNVTTEQVDTTAIENTLAALSGRLTESRAALLDSLPKTLVASRDDVLATQANTRAKIIVPPEVQAPDSGSLSVSIELLLYDSEGQMETPDAVPVFTAANAIGEDRSANLSAVTEVSEGRYRLSYTVANDSAIEQLVFTASVTEGGNTRVYAATMFVRDQDAVMAGESSPWSASQVTSIINAVGAIQTNADVPTSSRLADADYTAPPSTDDIAGRLFSAPANRLATDEQGRVASSNAGLTSEQSTQLQSVSEATEANANSIETVEQTLSQVSEAIATGLPGLVPESSLRTLTIQFQNASGEPVRNVVAEIESVDTQVSDVTGSVRFLLPDGDYSVRIGPPFGFVIPGNLPIQLSANRTEIITLAAVELPTLAGPNICLCQLNIITAHNEPIDGAVLIANTSAAVEFSADALVFPTSVDAVSQNGMAVLPLVQNVSYQITVQSGGRSISFNLDVPEQETASIPAIVLGS